MKNKLSDIHNYLVEELEWLMDRDLKGKKLLEEIKRAKAVNDIAMQIIANGRLMVNAAKAVAEWPQIKKLPLLLE